MGTHIDGTYTDGGLTLMAKDYVDCGFEHVVCNGQMLIRIKLK